MVHKVSGDNIKDCGSRIGTFVNMCFYLALHQTLIFKSIIVDQNPKKFYEMCVRVTNNKFPTPGVMVDTSTHRTALEELADYLGVNFKIYTSLSVQHFNYFADTYVLIGDISRARTVNLLCCRNHYMAFNCDLDSIITDVNSEEFNRVINECKELNVVSVRQLQNDAEFARQLQEDERRDRQLQLQENERFARQLQENERRARQLQEDKRRERQLQEVERRARKLQLQEDERLARQLQEDERLARQLQKDDEHCVFQLQKDDERRAHQLARQLARQLQEDNERRTRQFQDDERHARKLQEDDERRARQIKNDAEIARRLATC
jgi:hypothetical protein